MVLATVVVVVSVEVGESVVSVVVSASVVVLAVVVYVGVMFGGQDLKMTGCYLS